MTQPFTHEILVSWGDCDPAQIVYTGRIPNFCLDAINAFMDAEMGGGWFIQELDHNMGMPFVKMDIDFRAPVTPRHRLACTVRVERLGTKSVTFRVEGHQDGKLCFEGSFTEVFTIADQFKSQEIPGHAREVLEKHLIA
ncbi:acyl-CoA thioesterase [Maritimibacter dapengensis]|uniref:Acyl-CoA thioesterase n=1 Tax=Maritimibacter dapengensis TaxID=2836868 RepID=A0ABS6SXF6_9RHOB|nr:thioesterase family protein [Maritimibacter dapengensis]MBV7377644.1 acyl-CoA thioesterase [Maritimibacter dapengensis]